MYIYIKWGKQRTYRVWYILITFLLWNMPGLAIQELILQHSNRTVCNSYHFRRVWKFKMCYYCTILLNIILLQGLLNSLLYLNKAEKWFWAALSRAKCIVLTHCMNIVGFNPLMYTNVAINILSKCFKFLVQKRRLMKRSHNLAGPTMSWMHDHWL